MRGGVAGLGDLVGTLGENLAVLDDDGRERAAALGDVLAGDVDGALAKSMRDPPETKGKGGEPPAGGSTGRGETGRTGKLFAWPAPPLLSACGVYRRLSQKGLVGRYLPSRVMTARSPPSGGSATFFTSSLKLIAEMMPSPNSSWTRALRVVP